MEKNDHVHRLIHAMTRSEKRYFKLHLARSTSGTVRSNHAALFDAIAAMDEYDQEQLKERFKDAPFMKHFPIAKRRLYEALLNSLDAYHVDGSVQARLRRMLHQTEILFDRSLHQEAARLLRSVEALAQEHHAHAVLLEVVAWRRRLMERTNYQEGRPEELEQLADAAANALRQWEEHDRLWHLKSRSFITLYRTGKARDEQELGTLATMAQDPLLADDHVPSTPRAQYLYHHIRSAIAFARGDLQGCRTDLERNQALLNAEQVLVHEEPQLLLGVLGNLLHVHTLLGEPDRAQQCLKEFRRIPMMLPTAPTPDLERRLFAMGASMELALLSRTGRFRKAIERLPEFEEGLARHGEQLGVLRSGGLWFQIAWAHLGDGNDRQALRWVHRLLNLAGVDAHPELHMLARLLHLLVLAATGEWDQLHAALRNTERLLRSRQRTYALEQAILQFAHERCRKKHIGAPADHVALRDELARCAADPAENALFDHFDPWVWAESKVSGRSMSEVAAQGRGTREAA